MTSDAELVRAASQNDESAWNTLVDRHSQLIYANSRVIGADEQLAEDIVQTVWMRLLNRLDTIDGSKVRGWLAIVARNATRDELRKLKPKRDISDLLDLASDADTAHDAVTNSEIDSLRHAYQALSNTCQRLLSMLFYADMSYAEVSEIEQIPIGSVSDKRRTCLRELRSCVEAQTK